MEAALIGSLNLNILLGFFLILTQFSLFLVLVLYLNHLTLYHLPFLV